MVAQSCPRRAARRLVSAAAEVRSCSPTLAAMRLTAYGAIEANRRRLMLLTALAAALLTSVLGASVWIIGYDNARALSPLVVVTGGALFGSRDLVLLFVGAHPLSVAAAPSLYRRLDTLCAAFGLRHAPTVYVVQGSQPNALSLERIGTHGALVVTAPLLRLKADELDAVLAHELSHLTSAFVGLRVLTALLAGIVVAVATTRSLVHRTAALLVTALGVWLLGPAPLYFGALLTLFLIADARISREREHIADAQAVLVTRYPEALSRLLRRLDSASQARANPRVAAPASDRELIAYSLWMIRPQLRRGWLQRLLDAHPNASDRIRRLQRIS